MTRVTHSRAWLRLRTLLALTWPILVAQIAQTATGVVDIIMSGAVGADQLAGVAIGTSVWIPLFLFVIGLLTASSALIARLHGAGNNRRAIRCTVTDSLWVAFALGIAGAILVSLGNHLFAWMEVSNNIATVGERYLMLTALGIPGAALFQVFRSLSEGSGLSRPVMLVCVACFLLNIPLNYIFIHGLFGLPELKGAGCGAATAIVMWLQMALLFALLLRHPKVRHLIPQKLSAPSPAGVWSIVALGTPIAGAIFAEVSIFSVISLLIGHLGAITVAGHQIALNIGGVAFMLPLSIALALTVKVGHALGANDPKEARKVAKAGMLLALSCALFSATIMLTLPHYLIGLYTDNREVAELAQQLIFFAALYQFSDALQVSAAGALRGYKDTRATLWMTLLAYWGLGLPLGYSISFSDFWGYQAAPHGFWIGLLSGLSAAAVMLGWRLHTISRSHIEQS